LHSNTEKKILAFECLEDIIKTFSISDINVHMHDFISTFNDTLLLNYLADKYYIGKNFTSELLLSDREGNQVNFEEILKKHTGKLIYVDFWASWCAPCLKSLSDAEQLREEYKKKNVSFVYLSKDDNQVAWLKASKKYNLADQKGNYLIINSKVSDYLEKLKINTIPRYLLFDQRGQLIHSNAPGSGTEEIRRLLNKHLKK
jgi:thiol-disulfide isomerase/thioredoxin